MSPKKNKWEAKVIIIEGAKNLRTLKLDDLVWEFLINKFHLLADLEEPYDTNAAPKATIKVLNVKMMIPMTMTLKKQTYASPRLLYDAQKEELWF